MTPGWWNGFLRTTEFSGSKCVYFVLIRGSDIGYARAYAKRLCLEQGIVSIGREAAVMPEKYHQIQPAGL